MTELRGLSEVWRQEAAIETSLQANTPAVDHSRVYVGDMAGTFYAFSRADGTVAWSQSRAGAMSDSSACYHDDSVYVGSGGGAVYAFAGVDGSERWTYDGPSAVTSSPVVHDDVVYVGRNDGELLALDAADGSVAWQVSLDDPIYSKLSYSTAEDTVYVSTTGGQVHARDGDSGREEWSRGFGADVGSSSPVVDDDRGLVYFAASELMALATDSGESAWGTSFYGANAGSSPAFDADRVYLGGGDGSAYAVGQPDGMLATTPSWSFQTWDVSIAADPALADDCLFVASLDGNLYMCDTETGTEIDSVTLPCKLRSSPVVVDGVVYLGGRDGTVFAFEATTGL